MLIGEVCKKSGLTKKAVEYYEEQGLITPKISENGYRDFSEEDAELLKKTAVLRGLGLSVPDVKEIFKDKTILKRLAEEKNLEIQNEKAKCELLKELEKDWDWKNVGQKLKDLENRQSVLKRMQKAFPGYYGKYMCIHFGAYLSEPVTTKEQSQAYDTVISFLDNVSFELPKHLQVYLDEMTEHYDLNTIQNINVNVKNAMQDIERFVSDNKTFLESYMAYKETEEYKQSPAYELQEYFKKLNKENGYNDVFIPAMKKLSSKYREYCDTLEKANRAFLEKYPEYK